MNDRLHDLTNWIDHNRGVALAVAAIVAMIIVTAAVAGCVATTPGIVTPDRVDEAAFRAQAEQLAADLSAAQAKLDAQQQAIDALTAEIKESARSAPPPPALPADRPLTDAELAAVESYLATKAGEKSKLDTLKKDRDAVAAQAAELQAKMISAQSRIDAGLDDLDRQNAARSELLGLTIRTVSAAAQGNPVDLAATIAGLGVVGAGLLGLGKRYDTARKDIVIAGLKASGNTTTPPASG
ncbi:MAG TPA: hypothetical protein VM223_05485 [Planctomycetota bacterium]|nr:hypothetical protein [Planctomycetota bacterium]